MDEFIDYYAILQVHPKADAEVVDKAYKTLIMRHHPDRGGDCADAQLLNEAYSVIRDPARRAIYNLDWAAANTVVAGPPADARSDRLGGMAAYQQYGHDVLGRVGNAAANAIGFAAYIRDQQRFLKEFEPVYMDVVSRSWSPQFVAHLSGQYMDFREDHWQQVPKQCRLAYEKWWPSKRFGHYCDLMIALTRWGEGVPKHSFHKGVLTGRMMGAVGFPYFDELVAHVEERQVSEPDPIEVVIQDVLRDPPSQVEIDRLPARLLQRWQDYKVKPSASSYTRFIESYVGATSSLTVAHHNMRAAVWTFMELRHEPKFRTLSAKAVLVKPRS